jgi:hypothetical protein
MRISFSLRFASVGVLLTFVIALTSCFEVREEIAIGKDGAGSYTFLIDMSSSKNIIDMAMSMQISKDRTPFTQIDSSFAKGVERLSNIQGISNVQAVNNREQYVFGMTFDFQNIEALNTALNQSAQEQPENHSVFTFRKKELSRSERSVVSSLAEIEVLRSTPEGAAQVEAILQGASYVYVIRPKTGKIRSFSNKQGELQDNGKVFYYRVGLLDMMEKKVSPANTVKFKF